MNKKLNLKMLQDLTLANGISGFGEEAVEEANKYLSDTLITDRDSMQNLYI